jgi:putative membrane protein
MMWDGHDGMGWWMLWGSALWLIFIVGVVFVAAWFARLGAGGGTPAGTAPADARRETPVEIARRRYASGEISREEYEQIRRDLA